MDFNFSPQSLISKKAGASKGTSTKNGPSLKHSYAFPQQCLDDGLITSEFRSREAEAKQGERFVGTAAEPEMEDRAVVCSQQQAGARPQALPSWLPF